MKKKRPVGLLIIKIIGDSQIALQYRGNITNIHNFGT